VRTFDLAVIGGGITGLGVARLAARNGFSVALLERGDLVSGASSHSSHMLHGGLRYLENAHFALVRESLEERAAVSRMAPALTHPHRFLVPLYRGGRVPPWKLRLGLRLYDWFAGGHALAPRSFVRAREALELEPSLSAEGLLGAGLYSDAVMDDAALGIAVARDAAAHGASIHTGVEVIEARPVEGGAAAPERRTRVRGTIELGARDRATGATLTFETRTVVNATGPWCDETRRMLFRGLTPGAPDPAPLLKPSRGTHLVYPSLTRGHGLLLTAGADGRVFFVVPFGRFSLVGTTEIEVASPPPAEAFRPGLEELRYLKHELSRALPAVANAAPLAAFAGVRPLLKSEAEVGRASREHHVLDEHGVFTIAGGKYTTFRVMARDVVAAVAQRLARAGPLRDSEERLPPPVVAGASLEQLARHAAEHEFARHLDDVLRRRSLLWLEPDRGRVAAPVVAAALGEALGWSEARRREELDAYEAALREEEFLLQRAAEGP